LKAIAVVPGKKDTVHLTEIRSPEIGSVADGRGVRVEILEVGVDGTDKEINEALYGNAPPGEKVLVIGHESFGRVVEVGSNVREVRPGDFVAATVRRPGASIYDKIGTYDMTTDTVYYERGISYLHGFLTEQYVDEPEYLVKVPPGLAHVGVLMEPISVVEKGVAQAWEIQRRLKVWAPKRAAVMGAGTIGQLATLVLRLRGLEVVTIARTPGPQLKSKLVEEIGATYLSCDDPDRLQAITKEFGPFDVVFEATGSSKMAFRSLEVLAKNGILILTSITGGDQSVAIPADKINLEFVLYNKVMFGTVNAHRGYFEMGVQDFALAEATYGGWLSKLLTNPVEGLDRWQDLMHQLISDRNAVKVYMKVKNVL
jgi:threonine dehydrogenase-like Zn-dependent dehydrogenase